MGRLLTGTAIILGDDVDTDAIQPSQFFSLDAGVRRQGTLAAAHPGAGAILLAGDNFGMGSSRESVIRGLLDIGVRAVVAKSIARIFLRNAINHGLPAFRGLAGGMPFEDGDPILIDIERHVVVCETKGTSVRFDPLDPYLAAVLEAGGLRPYLELP